MVIITSTTRIYFVVKDFSNFNRTRLLIQATETAAISVSLAVKGKGHQSLNPIYKSLTTRRHHHFGCGQNSKKITPEFFHV